MSFTSKGTSELLVAGLQDLMFTIDVEKGTVTKQVCLLYGMQLFHKLTHTSDTYSRSLYNNETEQTHLCGDKVWRG
jgi:hypothetical protein